MTTWAVITEALDLLGRGRDHWYGQQPLVERIGLGGIVVDDFTVDLGARSLALMGGCVRGEAHGWATKSPQHGRQPSP